MTLESDVQASTATQEAESTHQDVNHELESSASQTDDAQNTNQTADTNEEGKEPGGWAIKRIGALTAGKHEAERKAAAATEEAARYRQLLEAQRDDGQQQSNQAQQPNIDELVSQRAEQMAQQQQIAERGQAVSKVGTESYTDWEGAVQTLDALGISSDLVQSLLGMDDAHKVIYSLGKNPDEASRILSLPPLQQGRELERLALKSSAAPPAKPVSKAPAPVSRVDGTTSVEAAPENMTTAEWMAWREQTKKTTF